MVKRLLFIVGILVIFAGCQDDSGGNNGLKPRKDIELSVSDSRVVGGNTDFAFRLFSQMNEMETEKGNWMISPFSLSMVLGMTSNGAAGNTLTEIKNVLGYENISMEESNAFYKMFMKELVDLDNTSQLNIANSIWVHDEIELYDSFVKVNKESYNAQVNSLNFTLPYALTTINGWCAEQTDYTIPTIVDKISDDTKLILLNALYFKGTWKEKFNEKYTLLDNFTNLNGTTSKVPMMTQVNSFPYVRTEYFSMGRFDYGNGAFNMTIFLPNEGVTLDEGLNFLNAENWNLWNDLWSDTTLDVKFPKFELMYRNELDNVLGAMGIKDAFSIEANFSELADFPLHIGLFEQASFLKVDEGGTVASSVSKGEDVDYAPQLVSFYMNRPFAFIISEQSTGSILFIGKITEL